MADGGDNAVDMKVDVNDKASAQLRKLADVMQRVAEVEKKLEDSTRRLAEAMGKREVAGRKAAASAAPGSPAVPAGSGGGTGGTGSGAGAAATPAPRGSGGAGGSATPRGQAHGSPKGTSGTTGGAAVTGNPFAGMGGGSAAPGAGAAAKTVFDRAHSYAGIAGNLGFSSFGSDISHYANMGKGMSDLGMPGAGAMMGRAAVPLAIAKAGVNVAASGAEAYHDPYMNDNQIGRKMFRDVVPGGATTQKLIDTFSGRSAKMQAAEVYGARTTNEIEARQKEQSFSLGWEPKQAGREERAKQLAGAQSIAMPEGDRRTAQGELEFRQASRMLPAKREIAKAERERAVASKELQSTQDQLVKIETRGLELETRRAELAKQTTDKQANLSGPEMQKKLLELQAVEGGIRENRQLSIEARSARQSASERFGQSDAAVKMAEAQGTRAQAANVGEQAQSAASRARALGRMNPAERIQAEAYYRLAMDNQDNLDALPPEARAVAAQFDPEGIGKMEENLGASTSGFKAGQKLAPAAFGPEGSTPESLRREQTRLENKAAEQEMGAEAGMAQHAAKAGADMAAPVINAIDRIRDSFNREIETKFRIQRNAQ